MKRSALVLALALAAAGLAPGIALADTLTFTVNNSTQTGAPGDTLVFNGTANAPTANAGTLYLNGDAYTISAPLVLDDTPYVDGFALSLDRGSSYTGELFTVFIPLGTPADTYTGSFQITGGPASSDGLTLGSADFSVNVSPASITPEPSSFVLLGTGLAGTLATLRRRRLA